MIHVVDALVRFGPGWFFAALVGAGLLVVLWRGLLPIYDRKVQAEIEIENKREIRKAEESRSREARDIERSRMEGRWIEQMERSINVQAETNRINESIRVEMESLRAANNALTETIQESREGSRTMLGKLDAIASFIKE